MSSPDIQLDQFPDEIRMNPISQLGQKKFEVLIGSYPRDKLSQFLDFHKVLLKESTGSIVRGTTYALVGALLYRLGPQHEILQFIEGVGIVFGTGLGALGVYGRSACVDGINILQRKIHNLRT